MPAQVDDITSVSTLNKYLFNALLCLSVCQHGNQLWGFFLTLSFKAVSNLSGSLVQVNDETSFMLKKPNKTKKPNAKPDFSELMDVTACNWSIAVQKNKESRFYYCDDASCFQLQQSNPHLPAFRFCLQSCHPVPVVSLASLLQFPFFSPPILFTSCPTLPFPNLFASGSLRSATPRVLINLFTLTSHRFNSRSWNSTKHWRRLWPSSWIASDQLKHARKEEMQLIQCFPC